MKYLFLSLFVSATALAQYGQDENVNGYYKKNGEYVQPYHRTKADNNAFNNYSTQGNVNPYTGKAGTVDPYTTQENYGQKKHHKGQ